ncbi:hypothetical protein NDU88_005412 [Pleurodeles waltl]|uniref:Uncharacterized protein n=1 Tax=Pleurodeles waltl TaxID=8319 RepID=A0AAV7WAD1_PLEWA|nr:hypothetical protein NDU88_005412 [Pleurodeles waltl]
MSPRGGHPCRQINECCVRPAAAAGAAPARRGRLCSRSRGMEGGSREEDRGGFGPLPGKPGIVAREGGAP